MKHLIQKIQDKRKTSSWEDYVIHMMSWVPMNFYKNSGHISRYPETPRSPKVMGNHAFEEIRDTLIDYGQDYDSSQGFFDQFATLFQTVPSPATIQQMAGEKSDYADVVVESRNTYLSNIVIGGSEEIYYSFSVVLASRNVFSSVRIRRSENIYGSFGIDNSQNVFYSKYIKDSNNIYLSSNLVGCQDCILCEDLQNKSHHIQNIAYSPEEYTKKKQELLKNKALFETFYARIHALPKNVNTHKSEGKLLVGCENVTQAISVNDIKQSRNVMFGWEGENYYDSFDFWASPWDFYGLISWGTGSTHLYCSNLIENCSNVFYSSNCNTSHHLFGCIGLKNKSYCILNKQYSKADWEAKVTEIMEDMDRAWVLWEFFPDSLNPFYYNHSLAGLMHPLSETQADTLWLLYQNETLSSDTQQNIVSAKDLPSYYDADGNISASITEVTIEDADGKYYTILSQELAFLNKYSLPIPSKHWLTRISKQMSEFIG